MRRRVLAAEYQGTSAIANPCGYAVPVIKAAESYEANLSCQTISNARGARRGFWGSLITTSTNGVLTCCPAPHPGRPHRRAMFKAALIASVVAAPTLLAGAAPLGGTNGLGSVFTPIVGNHVHKSIPPGIHGSKIGVAGGCIVSDRMKLIYVKTAKSAGSTILLGWLRPSLCPAQNDSDVYVGFGAPAQNNGNPFSKSCDESIISPRPGTDSLSCERIEHWKWEQYFVFASVRNPYSRMRSSYGYCKSAMTWDDFCEDPKLTGGCPGTKSRLPLNAAASAVGGGH